MKLGRYSEIVEPSKKTSQIFIARVLFYLRLFMQIMECCYYLNNANLSKNNAIKKEDDSNFVRLLTGSRALSNVGDTDVVIPKDKPVKQVPFSTAVVKKSTGKSMINYVRS